VNRAEINSAAAFLISFGASVFIFFFDAVELGQNLVYQLIYLLMSTLGFYFIFRLSQYVLSLWAYRHILGTWYYRTQPHDSSAHKDSNFAVIHFYIAGAGSIRYKVDLYPSFEAIEKLGSEPSRGHAVSKACDYTPADKTLNIVFAVTFNADDATGTREGRLSLRYVSAGHLEGEWASEVTHVTPSKTVKRQTSSGKMIAFRKASVKKLKLEA
jgi:hypothetical protein